MSLFYRILAAFAFMLLMTSGATYGESLNLVWNQNPEADIAGYHILLGVAPGDYAQSIDNGPATTASISNLSAGTTYYLAITAYNTAATESSPSAEVSYSVPGGPSPTPTPPATPPPTPTPTPIPGTVLDITLTPLSASFAQYSSPPLNLAGGTYLLTFQGQGTNFQAAMVDQVAIDGTVQVNGGFESPAQGSSHVFNPVGTGWAFVGGAGIQGNGSTWGAANAPEGSQTAFVQGSSPSSISQTFVLPSGTHVLSFYSAQRGILNVGYDQTLRVTLQLVTPAPTSTPIPAAPEGLLNVSTRGYVQTGENVLIGGVIIAGDTPKRVVLRAIGPSLAAAGVSGALPDPMLSLHDSIGATIASNDNWRTDPGEVATTGVAPSDDLEAAIVTTLAPGAYTAVVSGAGGGTGVALFEVYDVDRPHSRVVNISTRGRVEAGDNIMIGGFILGGDQPSQVVVRALGPSLTAHGVAGALGNPILELYNDHGTRIHLNDDWRSDQGAQISAVSLEPTDERESAIIATLPPGNYTAIVRGAQNSTGVCLVEVYNLTP